MKFNDSGIASAAVFPDDSYEKTPSDNNLPLLNGKLYLRLNLDVLKEFSPDVYLSYGGYWAARYAAADSRWLGIKNVFLLHNLAYTCRELFEQFDSVIVPSEFSQNACRERLNLETAVIPPVIDEQKVIAEKIDRKFLTFVNPTREKGAYFFLGILKALKKRGLELPVLVVEGRNSAGSFRSTLAAHGLTNVYSLNNVQEPREFYKQTKITLVPSFCEETFGRVAAESLLNGIPVISSDRGALPDVVGDSRFILKIPSSFGVNETRVAAENEVKEWVELIIRLWNDDIFYDSVSKELHEAAVSRHASQVVSEQMWKRLESLVGFLD